MPHFIYYICIACLTVAELELRTCSAECRCVRGEISPHLSRHLVGRRDYAYPPEVEPVGIEACVYGDVSSAFLDRVQAGRQSRACRKLRRPILPAASRAAMGASLPRGGRGRDPCRLSACICHAGRRTALLPSRPPRRWQGASRCAPHAANAASRACRRASILPLRIRGRQQCRVLSVPEPVCNNSLW